jgi:membrane protease YdiL (CAAX protease family)
VHHPAGWYPDPWIEGGLRYWDGSGWTASAAAKVKPPKPPYPTLPIVVALGALVVLTASLVLSKFVLDLLVDERWPIAVYIVISASIGYLPSLAFGWWASRRWGRASLRSDSGLFFRKADVGWGPVTWLSCVAVQVAIAALVFSFEVPFTGNTEGIGDLADDRGYVITILVTAVIAAPFVEEIVFRGLVLRGLLSRMGPIPAIAIQGVLFGVAHVDPVRGEGNLGLAMILSGVGLVLGGSAYLFRRLGPTIVSHMITNTVAMTVALLS